jgi:heme oxygenase (mycobilin-producing)
MIKVLIKRTVPRNKIKEMIVLFQQMHVFAIKQEGYVSAETYHNLNDPEEFLVISTWRSTDEWFRWLANSDHMKIQEKIDVLLGNPTQYAIYNYGFNE